jgi:hypothetical protein
MNVKTPDYKYFSVIRNVICPAGPSNIFIGDFFINDKGLYYFPYVEPSLSSPIVGGIAGGLIGGLIFSQNNKQVIKDSIKLAEERSINDYGLTMEERRLKHPYSIFIPRNDILKFDVDNNKKELVILMQNDKKAFIIDSVKDNYDKINKFISGEIIFDVDINEVGLGFPSPQLVVEWLGKNGVSPNINDNVINEMTENEKYMFSIHSAISNSKDEKIDIYENLIENYSTFSSILIKYFINDTRRYKQDIYGIIFFGIVIIIIISVNYKAITVFLVDWFTKGPIMGSLALLLLLILLPGIVIKRFVMPIYNRFKENDNIFLKADFSKCITDIKEKASRNRNKSSR